MANDIYIRIKSDFEGDAFKQAIGSINNLINASKGLVEATKNTEKAIGKDAARAAAKVYEELEKSQIRVAEAAKKAEIADEQAERALERKANAAKKATEASIAQEAADRALSKTAKDVANAVAQKNKALTNLSASQKQNADADARFQRAQSASTRAVQELAEAETHLRQIEASGTIDQNKRSQALTRYEEALNRARAAEKEFNAVSQQRVQAASKEAEGILGIVRAQKSLQDVLSHVTDPSSGLNLDSKRGRDVTAKLKEEAEAVERLFKLYAKGGNEGNLLSNEAKDAVELASALTKVNNVQQEAIQGRARLAEVNESITKKEKEDAKSLANTQKTAAAQAAAALKASQKESQAFQRAAISAFQGFSRGALNAGQAAINFGRNVLSSFRQARGGLDVYAAGWTMLMSGQTFSRSGQNLLNLSVGGNIDNYLGYEKGLTQAAIAGATDQNTVQELVFGIQTGAYGPRVSNFSAEELAKGAYYFSSAIGQDLVGGENGNLALIAQQLTPLLQLAQVSGTMPETSIKGIMNTALEFGINPRELTENGGRIDKIANMVGYLANISSMEVTDILNALNQVGPQANLLSGGAAGAGLLDALSYMYFASEAGDKGGRTGRGLSMLLSTIQGPSDALLGKFGEAFGIEGTEENWNQMFFNDDKTLKGGILGFIRQLLSTSPSNTAGADLISDLFSQNASRSFIAALVGMQGDTTRFDAMMKELNSGEAWGFLGGAASTTEDTLYARIQNIKNMWFQVTAEIIDNINGELKSAFDTVGNALKEVGDIFKEHPFFSKLFTGGLAALGGILTVVGGLLSFSGAILLVGKALRGVGGAMGLFIGFFTALPHLLLVGLPIIAALAAASVLLYRAWNSNFLGIKDLIQGLNGDVSKNLNNILAKIEAIARNVTEVFSGKVNEGFDSLIEKSKEWGDEIDKLKSLALSFAQGFVTGFAGVFMVAAGIVKAAFDIIEGLFDRFLNTSTSTMQTIGVIFGVVFGAMIASSLIPFRAQIEILVGSLARLAGAAIAAFVPMLLSMSPLVAPILAVVGGVLIFTAATQGLGSAVNIAKTFLDSFVSVVWTAIQGIMMIGAVIFGVVGAFMKFIDATIGLNTFIQILGVYMGILATQYMIKTLLGAILVTTQGFGKGVIGVNKYTLALAGIAIGIGLLGPHFDTLFGWLQKANDMSGGILGIGAGAAAIAPGATGGAVKWLGKFVAANPVVGVALAAGTIGYLEHKGISNAVTEAATNPQEYTDLVWKQQEMQMGTRDFENVGKDSPLYSTIQAFKDRYSIGREGQDLAGYDAAIAAMKDQDTQSRFLELVSNTGIIPNDVSEIYQPAIDKAFPQTMEIMDQYWQAQSEFTRTTGLNAAFNQAEKDIDAANKKSLSMGEKVKASISEALGVLGITGEPDKWFEEELGIDPANGDITPNFFKNSYLSQYIDEWEKYVSPELKTAMQQANELDTYQKVVSTMGEWEANQFYDTMGLPVPIDKGFAIDPAVVQQMEDITKQAEDERIRLAGEMNDRANQGLADGMTLTEAARFFIDPQKGPSFLGVGGAMATYADQIAQNIPEGAVWSNIYEGMMDTVVMGGNDANMYGQNIRTALANDEGFQNWAAEMGMSVDDMLKNVPKFVHAEEFVPMAFGPIADALKDIPKDMYTQLDHLGSDMGKVGIEWNELAQYAVSQSMAGNDWNLVDYLSESWDMSVKEVEAYLEDHGVDPSIINDSLFGGLDLAVRSQNGKVNIITPEVYDWLMQATNDGMSNIIRMTQDEFDKLSPEMQITISNMGFTFMIEDSVTLDFREKMREALIAGLSGAEGSGQTRAAIYHYNDYEGILNGLSVGSGTEGVEQTLGITLPQVQTYGSQMATALQTGISSSKINAEAFIDLGTFSTAGTNAGVAFRNAFDAAKQGPPMANNIPLIPQLGQHPLPTQTETTPTSTTITTTYKLNTDEFWPMMGSILMALPSIPTSIITTIGLETTVFWPMIGSVLNAYAAVPSSKITTFSLDTSTFWPMIGSLLDALAAIPTSKTVYINTVATSSLNGGTAMAGGGIVHGRPTSLAEGSNYEMVQLPNNTRVYSHGDTKRMLRDVKSTFTPSSTSGGDLHVTIENVNIKSEADYDKLFDKLDEYQARRARRAQRLPLQD